LEASSGVALGSKASVMTLVSPYMRLDASQIGPAMWVTGKAMRLRSPSRHSMRSPMPRAVTIRSPSLWRAPFGSAVVPDV
jgi:hypothetical protein